MLEAAASAEEGGEPSPDEPGTVTGGWLEGEIRRLQGLVRERAMADSRKPFTNEEFDQASAALITFARERGRFVNEEVSRLRAQRTVDPSASR